VQGLGARETLQRAEHSTSAALTTRHCGPERIKGVI
jgi:hypothetical protein